MSITWTRSLVASLAKKEEEKFAVDLNEELVLVSNLCVITELR